MGIVQRLQVGPNGVPDVSGETAGAGVESHGEEMGFPDPMWFWGREILPTSKIGISRVHLWIHMKTLANNA